MRVVLHVFQDFLKKCNHTTVLTNFRENIAVWQAVLFDPVLHECSLETQPVFLPALYRVRLVAMPHVGEKHETSSLQDGDGRGAHRLEDSPTLRDINNVKPVKYNSFHTVEKIFSGMSACRLLGASFSG